MIRVLCEVISAARQRKEQQMKFNAEELVQAALQTLHPAPTNAP